MAVLYTLAFPERVTHLILVEGISCDARDPYQPASEDNRLTDWSEFFADLENDFEAFTHKFAGVCFPGVDEATQSAIADFFRATAGPAVFESLWRGIVGFDLRPELKDVSVPTLVIHGVRDQHHPVAHGRYFAEHIPRARYLELDTAFHVPHIDPAVQPQMLVAIEEFLTGTVRHSAERRLTTVLFTDIVDSTAQQRAQGDQAWRNVLQLHEANTRRITDQFGGRLVEIEGDGAMMEFPTAGEALRAARTQGDAARELGIHIRCGLHAGEVYEIEGKLLGICVNVAARVTAQAAADQVLATEVVRGLVEGSDLTFTDFGSFDLKGIGVRHLSRLL